MMPVIQRDLQLPGPIGLLLHGMDLGAPLVEIADYRDRLSLRRHAKEVDRFGHVPGRVTVVGAIGLTRMHGTQRLRGIQQTTGTSLSTGCRDKEPKLFRQRKQEPRENEDFFQTSC